MSTDCWGVKAKNRGQSYVHISLTIASRGVIALLIGILIKSERPILSRQFPFRLIIRPLITPPQITASVTVERTHADASYVKYNIEHRAGDEKSQSKPLSPSFSPLSLFSSWCHCILWLIGTQLESSTFGCAHDQWTVFYCDWSIDYLPTNGDLFVRCTSLPQSTPEMTNIRFYFLEVCEHDRALCTYLRNLSACWCGFLMISELIHDQKEIAWLSEDKHYISGDILFLL